MRVAPMMTSDVATSSAAPGLRDLPRYGTRGIVSWRSCAISPGGLVAAI